MKPRVQFPLVVALAALLGLGASRNFAVDIDLIGGSGLKIGGTTVIDSSRNLANVADLTFAGKLIQTPSAVQTLAEADAITATAGLVQIKPKTTASKGTNDTHTTISSSQAQSDTIPSSSSLQLFYNQNPFVTYQFSYNSQSTQTWTTWGNIPSSITLGGLTFTKDGDGGPGTYGTYSDTVTAVVDRTLTSAPTIADGTDGQRTTVINVGVGSVTIQDQGTLGSSNLRLSNSTLALGARDSVTLLYSSTIGDWIQIAPLVNVI